MMSVVMNLYQLIRDLIDEAKKQKNAELVGALIDIKEQVNELEDENKRLRRQIELMENIVRHPEGTYITLKDDPLEIKYCSTCWGNEKKLIQLKPKREDVCDEMWNEIIPLCPVCLDRFVAARNSGK